MNTIELICTLLGAIAIVLGGVWFIVQRAFKFGIDRNRLQQIEGKLYKLPCDTRKEQISDTRKAHADLYKTVMSTNEMVTEISKWVMRIDGDMINQLVKKGSPFQITPVGRIILDNSGAKKTIDNNIDKLISLLESTEPKTPYDVENNASTVLLQNMGDDMFIDIKNFLYFSPDKIEVSNPVTNEMVEITLSIHAIIKVMSIYLRDKYFQKHPEMDTSNFK